MHFAIVSATAVVCMLVALSDLRTRRIPNALPATIAVLGVLRLGFTQDLVVAVYTLGAAGMVFTVTLMLFRCGGMGGGDAKTITATILVIGYQQVLGFLFVMSLCGGALVLTTLATEKLECFLRGQRDQRRGIERQRLTVPYGVAVAAAGIVSLIGAR